MKDMINVLLENLKQKRSKIEKDINEKFSDSESNYIVGYYEGKVDSLNEVIDDLEFIME